MCRSRVRTSGLSVGVTAAAILLFGIASYVRGRAISPELLFLDPRRPPTANEAAYAIAAEHAVRCTESPDVIFIGDSTCNFGVDPLALKDLTGLTAYNSGTLAWMGPDGFRLLLDEYLQRDRRPRLAVLCVSPFLFEIDIASKDPDTARRFIEVYGQRGADAPAIHKAAFLTQRGALNLLPAAGTDPRIASIDGDAGETYWTLRDRLLKDSGLNRLRGLHGPAGGHGPQEGPLIRDDWRAGVAQIAANCERARVPLLIAFTPINQDGVGLRDWRELEQLAVSLERRHKGLRVARPIVTAFPDDLLWDAIHLNARGVEHFMPIVAKDVQGALGK